MGNDAWPKLMLDTQCGAAHMLSGFETVFEQAQGGARPTRLWSVRRGSADAPTAFNSCGRATRIEQILRPATVRSDCRDIRAIRPRRTFPRQSAPIFTPNGSRLFRKRPARHFTCTSSSAGRCAGTAAAIPLSLAVTSRLPSMRRRCAVKSIWYRGRPIVALR